MARQLSLVEIVRAASPMQVASAREAYTLFVSYCGGPMFAAPGMDTLSRLIIRIHQGRTIEEAAAREYLYRWNLALRSRTFGIPHTIGL